MMFLTGFLWNYGFLLKGCEVFVAWIMIRMANHVGFAAWVLILWFWLFDWFSDVGFANYPCFFSLSFLLVLHKWKKMDVSTLSFLYLPTFFFGLCFNFSTMAPIYFMFIGIYLLVCVCVFFFFMKIWAFSGFNQPPELYIIFALHFSCPFLMFFGLLFFPICDFHVETVDWYYSPQRASFSFTYVYHSKVKYIYICILQLQNTVVLFWFSCSIKVLIKYQLIFSLRFFFFFLIDLLGVTFCTIICVYLFFILFSMRFLL